MKNHLHKLLAAAVFNGSILLWPNPENNARQAFPSDSQECLDIDNRDDSDECKVETAPTQTPTPPLDLLRPSSTVGEPEQDDPMLERMPTADFVAYKRQDISSMYHAPRGTFIESVPKFQGIAAKFVNMSPEPLDLMWDNGGEEPTGSFWAHIEAFESGGATIAPNHKFYFVRPKANEIVCSMRIRTGTSVYFCNPFVENDHNDPSAGVVWGGNERSLDTLDDKERILYNAALYNREFGYLYEDFTGSPWYGNYPQEPPKHHMHRADYFGQEHTITTVETQFTSLPPEEELYRKLSVQEMMRNETSAIPFQEYREEGKMDISITALSVAPRIFEVEGFLSDVEVDHIIELAKRTTTESGEDIQTTQTTWIPRHYSPIMDAVIKRAADVLKIDEALFRHRLLREHLDMPGSIPIIEDLQIVHYGEGTEYVPPHNDHGSPYVQPNAPQRSINLCLYLNDGMEGGETVFPRWRNAETDEAIKVVPKKGKAIIYYMKNPDGNLDDLSQRVDLPVVEGEKWFANLWTWDPILFLREE